MDTAATKPSNLSTNPGGGIGLGGAASSMHLSQQESFIPSGLGSRLTTQLGNNFRIEEEDYAPVTVVTYNDKPATSSTAKNTKSQQINLHTTAGASNHHAS